MKQRDGFGRGIPRSQWARFVFLGEHGDTIRRQTRQERREQKLPDRVEVVL